MIQTLEERLLGTFSARNITAQLEADFTTSRATARSYSVGSLTPFQGHTICLDPFLFPDAFD